MADEICGTDVSDGFQSDANSVTMNWWAESQTKRIDSPTPTTVATKIVIGVDMNCVDFVIVFVGSIFWTP